jgi:hypothetical protein
MSAAEALHAATLAIWNADPKGAARLAKLHRPPSGDMPKRLYANFDAYWLAGVFYQIREGRRTGALDLAAARQSAALFAAMAPQRLRLWGFEEEAAAIEAAIPEIKAASAETLDAVLKEMITLIDRLNAWIDSTIPWAKLGDVAPVRPEALK